MSEIIVFDDANFQGRSQALGVGRYDWGDIANDSISSLRVPSGMRVTLFEHTHFQGAAVQFTSDAAYVGDDFNDKTSSIVVEEIQPAPGGLAVEILQAHNQVRAGLGLPLLNWSDSLAQSAQSWASQLAANGGALIHSNTPGVGENLASGSAGAFTASDLVRIWVAEGAQFTPGTAVTNDNLGAIGHYTQMVWRDTTEVGGAIATGGGSDILVCQYAPPGNFLGRAPY